MMDTKQFDRALQMLATTPSRRQVFGGMFGALVVGVLGSTDPVSAKGRKRKGGRGRRKKPPVGQGRPSRPALPRPVARPDATCTFDIDPAGVGYDVIQLAQTFRAQRTGQLTNASVTLFFNAEGAALDIEIWSVGQNGAPEAFLTGTTVTDIPFTDSQPPRTVTATFPTPANVVAGTRYALVVGFEDSTGKTVVRISRGNPCADGLACVKSRPNAAWVAQPASDVDFATVVTA
jgi:hypothetical protein